MIVDPDYIDSILWLMTLICRWWYSMTVYTGDIMTIDTDDIISINIDNTISIVSDDQSVSLLLLIVSIYIESVMC